jgi:hypothetical protein
MRREYNVMERKLILATIILLTKYLNWGLEIKNTMFPKTIVKDF